MNGNNPRQLPGEAEAVGGFSHFGVRRRLFNRGGFCWGEPCPRLTVAE